MLAKDFRQKAWAALHGKWGAFALAMLVYTILFGLCSAVPAVGSVATALLAGPFVLGFAIMGLKVMRGEEIKVENLFDGFKNFVPAMVLTLVNDILIALWSLLFVIPGIVKAYSYAMSIYILADNPGMSQNEARKESMRMMQGHKWRLFCLQFSFIGWYVLTLLTCGILALWVGPYVQTATAAFYEELKSHKVTATAETAGPEL